MTGPFARFLKIEAAAGGLLLCVSIIALALANSPWTTQYLELWETPIGLRWGQLDVTRSLLHWINDGLMTLFFFVIALELKRELVLGELRNPRAAALPFFAALGGMLVPVLVYISILDGQPGASGWGTVMATDTAFVIGALALFGKAIPASLRIFLVSLAVFDDVGAIMVVAIAYGDTVDLGALALAAGFLSIVYIMARIGIRSIPMFFIVGLAVWLSFDASGLHATIAGVILGLMTPARAWVGDERMRMLLGKATDHPRGEHWSGNTTERSDLQAAGRAIEEALSPLERLEIMLLPWVGFAIMPVFALANAGHHPERAGIVGDFRWVGHRQAVRCLALLLDSGPPSVGGIWRGSRLGLLDGRCDADWDRVYNVNLHCGFGICPYADPGCQGRNIRCFCGSCNSGATDVAVACRT